MVNVSISKHYMSCFLVPRFFKIKGLAYSSIVKHKLYCTIIVRHCTNHPWRDHSSCIPWSIPPPEFVLYAKELSRKHRGTADDVATCSCLHCCRRHRKSSNLKITDGWDIAIFDLLPWPISPREFVLSAKQPSRKHRDRGVVVSNAYLYIAKHLK